MSLNKKEQHRNKAGNVNLHITENINGDLYYLNRVEVILWCVDRWRSCEDDSRAVWWRVETLILMTQSDFLPVAKSDLLMNINSIRDWTAVRWLPGNVCVA